MPGLLSWNSTNPFAGSSTGATNFGSFASSQISNIAEENERKRQQQLAAQQARAQAQAQNQNLTGAVNQGLDKGESWEKIAGDTGVPLAQVKQYSQSTRPNYGIPVQNQQSTKNLNRLTEQNMPGAMQQAQAGENWFERNILNRTSNKNIAEKLARSRALKQYGEQNNFQFNQAQTPSVISFENQSNQLAQKDVKGGLESFLEGGANTVAKSVNTVGALGAGIGGLGKVGLESVFGSDQDYQNALNQARDAMNYALAKGYAGAGGFISPEQAQNASLFGNSQQRKDLLQPIASGVGEVAPWVLPYGQLAKFGGVAAKPVENLVAGRVAGNVLPKLAGKATQYATEAGLTAPVFAGTTLANQYGQNGQINLADAIKSGLLQGAMVGGLHAGGDLVVPAVRAGSAAVKSGAQNLSSATKAFISEHPELALRDENGFIRLSPASKHPAILELNDTIQRLRKMDENYSRQGLPINSPIRKANAKSQKLAIEERSRVARHINQGGYVKNPLYGSGDRTNIQRNLADAIKNGTNKPVYFGELSKTKLAQINKLRSENELPPLTDSSVRVYPNAVKHLKSRRVDVDKLTPDQVADIAYSAIHNTKSRVLPSRYAHNQTLLKSRAGVSKIAHVGGFDGATSLKTAYPIKTNRLNDLAASDEAKSPIRGSGTTKNTRPDTNVAKTTSKVKSVDPLTDLKQEALKYKSADEFVKAQGESLYHGGTKLDKVGNMRSKWGALYATENPTYAKSFGGKDSVLNEVVVSKDAKLADLRKPSKELVDQIAKKIDDKLAKAKPYDDKAFSLYPYSRKSVIEGIQQGKGHWAEIPEVKQVLKELGYDGQLTKEVPFASNYGVWNKDKIRTKQQLTDLYNQAHAEAKASSVYQSSSRVSQSDISGELRQKTSSQKPTSAQTSVNETRSHTTPGSTGKATSLKSDNATKLEPKSKQLQSPDKLDKTKSSPSPSQNRSKMVGKQQLTQSRGLEKYPESSLVESPRSYDIDNTTNVVKTRGLARSVKSSTEVSPKISRKVNGTYNVRSTSKLAAEADEFAKMNLKDATASVNDRLSVKKGRITDQDVADSLAVAKRLDHTKQFDASQQIYDKLAEHGTASGQTIQAFSLLKNRTPDGIKFQIVRDLKKAGVVLNNADQVKLSKLIDDIRNTRPDTESRSRALFSAMDFAAKHTPTNRGDKLANFWRAGLLTAPKTTGGNLLGNTGEALTRDLWANPIAAATDKFFSLFTGKRTKVLAGGRLAGAKEGFARGKDYLKTGFDTRNIGDKFDIHKRPNYNNKLVDNYVNGVYRWMGAQDQPFYYAAKSAAVHDLAKADGMNLGYKGDKLAKYVEGALHNDDWRPQTFKTARDATEYAKYSVFQNDTILSHMAGGLKTALGKKNARWLADFIMPFTQVPSSVAMRIIDRTPVGILKELVSQVKNKAFDQRAMAEAIGNGSFGIGVIGAGLGLAKSGLITGAYPKDPKERKLWQSEGKQEYSIKVGDRWYSLNYLQPFGSLLAIGKQVADDKKAGMSNTEAWNNAAAAAAQSVSNQSFLQGLNGVVSAISDPQESAGQFTKSLATSSMPNFIRSLASATDSKQRDTKSLGNALKGTVPGLRETVPTKQDMFGKSVPSKDNWFNMYANPLNPSKSRDTKGLVNELQRLQDTQNGIVPTQFSKTSITGVKLNDNQVRQLNALINPKVEQAWSSMIADPRYKQLSDEDKTTALKRAKDNIASAYRRQFMVNNNIPIKKSATAKEESILLGQKQDFLANAGSSSGGGVAISPSLKPTYKQTLAKYNAMSADDRNDTFFKQNDAEYKYDVAKWQNELTSGKTISPATKIRKQSELAKGLVGSKYPKAVRDLYSISETTLQNWLATPEKGLDKKKIWSQLQAYDKALANASLISKPKYANGLGRSSGSGSSKGKQIVTLSQLGNIIKQTSKPNIIKTGKLEQKTPTPKFNPDPKSPLGVALQIYKANKARNNFTVKKGIHYA